MTNETITVEIPEDFKPVVITDYLKSRRFNRDVVKAVTREVTPLIEAYNARRTNIMRFAVLRFCMNSKYQQLEASMMTYGDLLLSDDEDGETNPMRSNLLELVHPIERILAKHYGHASFEDDDHTNFYTAKLDDKEEEEEDLW